MMKKISVFDLPIKYSNILVAGLLTLTLVIPFGLQIGQLGLYGDDWANVLMPSTRNGAGGWMQTALINILGAHPLPYHFITMFLSLVVVFLLHRVFIQAGLDPVSALTAAILTLVFPGFSQSISALTLFPILLGLVLVFGAALLFAKWAEFSTEKSHYFAAGLICSVGSIFLSPFSAILMGFLFLIFIPGWRERRCAERIRLGVLGAAMFFGAILSQLMIANFKAALSLNIVVQSIRVWLNSYVIAWRQIIGSPVEGGQTFVYLVLIVLASLFLYWLLRMLEKTSVNSGENSRLNDTNLDIQILIFSAASGLILIFLVKVFGVALSTQYPDDLGMFVVGILASVFIVMAVKLILVDKYRLAVLVILIVLSTGIRFSQISRYTTESARLEDILSQLAVHGDEVKKGTVLISEQLPLNFTSQKAIDALLQKLFNKDAPGTSGIYINGDEPEFREFLRNDSQKEIELRIEEKSIPIKKDGLIGFWVNPAGCVQILDTNIEDTHLPQGLKYLVPLSDPHLLINNGMSDVLQLDHFRTTIENDWCFYYQLAGRQAADAKWDDVLLTYEMAEKQGLKPQAFSDQIPLLNASLRQKPISMSLELSKGIISSPEQKNIICTLWNEYKLESDLKKEVLSEIREATRQLKCDN